MIIVECQWITFDEWLFDEDNETLRLARVLECALMVGRPIWTPYKDRSSFKKDYLWLPLYIASFGEELVQSYGRLLTLYGCGELHRYKPIKPLDPEIPGEEFRDTRHMHHLNFYSVRNRYIRDH